MGQYDLFRKISQSSVTTKAREVNQIKYDIAQEFDDSPSYESVLIDGVSKGVHIVTDKKDNKKMLSRPDELFTVGQIVTWKSNKFLVTDIDEDQQIQTKGTILLCNNVLNVYKNSVMHQIPCAIESNVRLYQMSQNDNKYFTELTDNIIMRLPKNNTTSLIKVDETYQLGMYRYSVQNISDVIEPGLLILKMQITSQEIIPIPDPEPILPLGLTAKIINPITSIIKGQTAHYTGQFYEDKVEIDSELATFYLTDSNGLATDLATITAQNTDGSCTVLAGSVLGYVKLWMKNADASIVSEGVDIRIKGIFY